MVVGWGGGRGEKGGDKGGGGDVILRLEYVQMCGRHR